MTKEGCKNIQVCAAVYNVPLDKVEEFLKVAEPLVKRALEEAKTIITDPGMDDGSWRG